jgi:hypothetical protein
MLAAFRELGTPAEEHQTTPYILCSSITTACFASRVFVPVVDRSRLFGSPRVGDP